MGKLLAAPPQRFLNCHCQWRDTPAKLCASWYRHLTLMAASSDSSAGLSSGRTGPLQVEFNKAYKNQHSFFSQGRQRCIWLEAYTQSWKWKNNLAFYLLFFFFLFQGFSLLLFLSKSVKKSKKIFAQLIIPPVPGLLPAMTNSIHNIRILCVSLKYLIILLGPEKFICDPCWQLF